VRSKLSAAADQTVDITDLPLRQDVLTKNASISAQRDFGLGNSPLTSDSSNIPIVVRLALQFL